MENPTRSEPPLPPIGVLAARYFFVQPWAALRVSNNLLIVELGSSIWRQVDDMQHQSWRAYASCSVCPQPSLTGGSIPVGCSDMCRQNSVL
eukprot:5398848-Amphidinium_carterae.1